MDNQIRELKRGFINGRALYNKLEGHEVVPCEDIRAWGEWMESTYTSAGESPRIVKRTNVDIDTTVSTVFLGIDHSFGFGDGKPQLFETMVFENGKAGNECWRCATWREAEAQHAKVLAMMEDRP